MVHIDEKVDDDVNVPQHDKQEPLTGMLVRFIKSHRSYDADESQVDLTCDPFWSILQRIFPDNPSISDPKGAMLNMFGGMAVGMTLMGGLMVFIMAPSTFHWSLSFAAIMTMVVAELVCGTLYHSTVDYRKIAYLQSPALFHSIAGVEMLLWSLPPLRNLRSNILFTLLSIAGIPLFIGALYMRITAIRQAAWQFTYKLRQDKEERSKLITTGLYAWDRHPSYVASLLAALAIGLISWAPISTVGMLYISTRWLQGRIGLEEERLKGIYGQEYTNYCHQVPARITSMLPLLTTSQE